MTVKSNCNNSKLKNYLYVIILNNTYHIGRVKYLDAWSGTWVDISFVLPKFVELYVAKIIYISMK